MNAPAPEAARDRRVGGPALWLVFGLALILRVGFAIDYAHHHPGAERPAIDEAAYEDWALEIAGGDWVGDEVFFQEPLYPYWLATLHAVWGVGDEADTLRRGRTAARHVQALYGAIAAVLVAVGAARLFGRRAGIVAGLACATYRPLCFFPALFLKPNLVVPLVALLPLAFLWLRAAETTRARCLRAGALGVLAGLGALLRGNLLLLAPALVALPLVQALVARRGAGRGLAASAAAALGAAAVLLPVALRNLAVGGVLALTTSGAGTNLYGGNNPENPYGVAREFAFVRGVPEHEADDWRHEAERRSGRLLDPGEVSAFWVDATLRSIRERPGLHARILWNKLRLTLGAYEVPDNHHLAWDARHVSALRLWLPGFGVWGVLGLAGLFVLPFRRARDAFVDRRGAWELAGLFALYLATIVLTVTSMRIRLALVPLLLPFAGYLVELVLRRARPAGWASALVVAALVVHWPVIPAEERAEDLIERDHNLAVQRLREGDLDGAREAIDVVAAERPDTVPVALLEAELAYARGRAALAAGDPAGAERYLDRALALLKPIAKGAEVAPRDRFRARKLAAFVQFDAGAWAVAERRAREALAFDPSDRELRVRLANCLWKQAEDAPPEARVQRLSEARELVLGLLAEERTETLAAFLAAIEAALAE